MGRAASVAFGSFGVFYGGVAVAAGARVRLWVTRVSGAYVLKRRPRLVVDGTAVDVDVRHVHVAVRHARRLCTLRVTKARDWAHTACSSGRTCLLVPFHTESRPWR